MKKLALTFFILLGLTTNVVSSQEEPTILSMPVMTVCTKTTELDANLLTQYGEIPAVVGPAMVMHDRFKEYVPGVIKMYVNTQTYTFTIVFENPQDGISCVMATGDELRPARQGTQL